MPAWVIEAGDELGDVWKKGRPSCDPEAGEALMVREGGRSGDRDCPSSSSDSSESSSRRDRVAARLRRGREGCEGGDLADGRLTGAEPFELDAAALGRATESNRRDLADREEDGLPGEWAPSGKAAVRASVVAASEGPARPERASSTACPESRSSTRPTGRAPGHSSSYLRI